MILKVAMQLLMLHTAAMSTPPSSASSALVMRDCTFGEVYQFAKAGCTASLENKGSVPLKLSVTPVQPGLSVQPNKLELAPHSKASLSLRVLTDNIAGSISWTYRVAGAGADPRFVHATGFVSSVLDAGHPDIAFGSITSQELPVSHVIELTSSLVPDLRATKVLSKPSWIHTIIASDGKSLRAELGSDAPWGAFEGVIKLAIDSEQQKQAWVQVSADIKGEVGPPNNPYWLGEVPWESDRQLIVPLLDGKGRGFTIGKVTSDEFAATYSTAACKPPQTGCRNLVIHVSDLQPAGLFKSVIDVALMNPQRHLLVTIWGALGERPMPGETAAPPVMKKIPVELSQADDGVSLTPPLKEQPDPPGDGPLLKWTISQQGGVYGYEILRSDSPNGPFVLVNPKIIPKVDNGKGAVSYRWRDTSAIKGHKYWYYIAVITSRGDRKALSEPHETIAK